MAELTCPIPSCGRTYPPGTELCEEDFAALVPSGPPDPAPVREAAPPAPAARPGACAACGGELTPGAAECDYCGTPAVPAAPGASAAPAGPVRLTGPWGAVEIGPERLVIGRTSPVEQVAGALADLDIVSRRHAEIVRSDDGVWLVDVGSANGTFVNERRLATGVPVVVRPGDAIRLGSSVHLDLVSDHLVSDHLVSDNGGHA